jgi:hypothetical protein
MRLARRFAWLGSAILLFGCSGGGSSAMSSGREGSSGHPSSSGGPTSSGTASGAAPASAGTSSTSGAAPGSGIDAGPPPPAPTVALANVGRHGETLLIQLQGSDPAAQTTEAHVQLLDASGSPVNAFDTNWDGKPDSNSTRLHFDQSTLGQKTFTATITLSGFYALNPSIASASVSLSNVFDAESPAVTANLGQQALAPMNGACDPKEMTNRCDDGFACTGTPATCQPAPAPSFSHVAYYGGASPTEVFEGADPAGALSRIGVSFLDTSGNPVDVDLGDGTLVTSVLLPANGVTDPTFSYVNSPAQSFAAAVAKISATPMDSLGRMGPTVMATLTTQPLAATARACDATGFIACYQGSACAPGIVGANNICSGVPTLQAAKCAAAPAVVAPTGILAAWGVAQGVSLWDPPPGCILPTEVNHSEALVTLKLAQSVNMLTVSTAVPETNFDTVVYILPACATSSTQAIGCNDDDQGYTSTVTAMNVPAGTYTIVVDSAGPNSGQFGLTVATQ